MYSVLGMNFSPQNVILDFKMLLQSLKRTSSMAFVFVLQTYGVMFPKMTSHNEASGINLLRSA